MVSSDHTAIQLPLAIEDAVVEIPLSQGLVTIIDARDFALICNHKWYASKGGNTQYAVTNIYREDRSRGRLALHRVLMDAPAGMDVDHIDGDGLNNRRSNLRLATRSQNIYNKPANRGGTSKFKGVHWNPKLNKWRASVTIKGVKTNIGCFVDEADAARAYDVKARELFGEYARLNFPEG